MSIIIPKIINGINCVYNSAIMVKVHYGCISHYRKMLKINGFPNSPAAGEADYKKKWSALYPLVAVEDYRLFSHYIDVSPNLVPEAISHNIIEPIMVPLPIRAYYSDKNMFDKIMPNGFLPQTILRYINGTFFTPDYDIIKTDKDVCLKRRLEPFERIVIKPTVDSSSGQRVTLFSREGDRWRGVNGQLKDQLLSLNLLKNFFGHNFIIQKHLKQSSFMNNLCSTSVNTIRLFVYRSVTTNEVVIPSAIMRIGHTGDYVDNSHAGGVSIGILPDGKLNNYTTDQYGRKIISVNGNDFCNQQFIIPDFNRIIEFAKQVGEHLIHCRMSNIDVMIDETGSPKLIEYNLNSMSTWLYQFNIGVAYGEYCDEIIYHCKKHLYDVQHIRVDY